MHGRYGGGMVMIYRNAAIAPVWSLTPFRIWGEVSNGVVVRVRFRRFSFKGFPF